MESKLITIGSIPKEFLSATLFTEFSKTDVRAEDEVAKSGSDIFVSLCSTGTFLCIVTPSCRAQFFVHEVEEDEQQGDTYRNSFQGILHGPEDDSSKLIVTALIVIPIGFKRDGKLQRASIALVGFSDGYVRGYSKSGQNIFSQRLQMDPVTKLSYLCPPSSNQDTNQETLVVMHNSIICIIDGWSIVLMIQSNVAKMNEGIGWSEHDEDTPHLIYKKWHLKDQVVCVDVALLRHSTPTAYDYLCEASSVTGFEASMRSTPMPEARLLSVGEHPMIALYKITKDAGQINVSEVMHAVASKMKKAVLGRISQAGGWLGWGGQQQKPQQHSTTKTDEKILLSSDLPMDCSIPDNRRSVLSIAISPLGNLAALVDSFGRILLLNCDSLAIRRMWKGYRDAQCGWILVNDKTFATKHKSRTKGTNKTAQCLCIYACRRGILELWPTQCGRRLAAFQIGKDCKLLYSPYGVFTPAITSSDENNAINSDDILTLLSDEGVKNTTVVLTPIGDLLTISVPLPCLLSLDDPLSHDVNLIKKLVQTLNVGEEDYIKEIISDIKSTKYLKQAIDTLIKFYPIPRVSLVDIIDLILRKIDVEIDPDADCLCNYLMGCQQLIKLELTLNNLHHTDSYSDVSLMEIFQKKFKIPHGLALYASSMLEKYYKAFDPPKKVVKDFDLLGKIRSFKLPSEVGDHLLTTSTNKSPESNRRVTLHLKDESDPSILDLGSALLLVSVIVHLYLQPLLAMQMIFQPILQSGNRITEVFEQSGISRRTLLILFCQLFLSGKVNNLNPCVLHQILLTTIVDIFKVKDNEDPDNLWMTVCRQCAITANVGHAFSIVLTHQSVCSLFEDTTISEEEGNEQWESVTTQRGHWATLYHNLEVLVHLCNIVGVETLRKLPSVPYVDLPESFDGPWKIDPATLQLKFFDKVYKMNMCAASLKNIGPCLISHCLCEWFIRKKVSPEFILQLSGDDPKSDCANSQLNSLLKLLPSSLSQNTLFIHCIWQAMYVQDDFNLGLHYISQLFNPQIISGVTGLLWCYKFENTVAKLIENIKRGNTLDQLSMKVVSVCRILFGYMFQFTMMKYDTMINEEDCAKNLMTNQSQERRSLVDIVVNFPDLNLTVIHTCLELLMMCEITIQQGSAINIISFFPNWMRNSLKRGVYKSAWQEQIPIQLQQKRLRFLMNAVTIYFQNEPLPIIMTSAFDCPALFGVSTDALCIDVSEYQDLVFVLAQLWKLDLDRIKNHWVCNLFAAGLVDQGKKVFLTINDKTDVLNDLLSLAGSITDHLLHSKEERATKLALLAQTSPTLLEWMRKQNSNVPIKSCKKIEPRWSSMTQLINLIVPYLSQVHNAKDKVQQLDKILKLLK